MKKNLIQKRNLITRLLTRIFGGIKKFCEGMLVKLNQNDKEVKITEEINASIENDSFIIHDNLYDTSRERYRRSRNARR